MEQRDYVFRYPVEVNTTENWRSGDRPMVMIRRQLRNLLNVLIPCEGLREVRVDGFKLLSDRSTVHGLSSEDDSNPDEGCKVPDSLAERLPVDAPIFQDARNVALHEPRIDLIKKQLESVLALIDLECNGQVVKVDGFRLKDVADWVTPSTCDPSEVFEYAGTRCNCNCVFCYNKGTPSSLALGRSARPAVDELREMETRLRHFDPVAKRSLFLSLGSTREVLAHPYALDILRRLRQRTERPFRIPTNGAALTPEMIEQLSKLSPLYLDVSLNSASPSRRARLMRDRQPEVAIQSLPLLREAGIPYSVVIVPWPLETETEMLEDLEDTVAYAAECGVRIVQISLPGYSRFFSSDTLFDRQRVWSSVVWSVQGLREKHSCPIVVMPGMFEENLSRSRKNVPEVIGLVVNSPAALGGLRRGDVIKQIGGVVVLNRPQARDILSIVQRSQAPLTTIMVRRDSRDVECHVDLRSYSYPFDSVTGTHLGVVFMGTGLRVGYLERLGELVDLHNAKRVLFLSSELVRPTFEQCLRESPLLGQVDIEVAVPRNRFFGGNIIMGDLLVVDDFVSCIEEHSGGGDAVGSGRKPDLIVIPSSPFSLGQWGRDLTGQCYLEIERRVGIPVELLECETIYD